MRFLTRYFRALVLITAALALVGCTAPRAKPDADLKAKQFTPQAETASLYIYRSEMTGASAPMTVSVNNQSLGKTNARTYYNLEVAPGSYTVVSSADNTSSVTVEVEAGRSYYVWQKVTMSMGSGTARAQVSLVSEAQGQKGVLASKLLTTKVRPSAFGVAPAAGSPPEAPAAAPVARRAAAGPTPASPTATAAMSMPHFVPDAKPVSRVARPAAAPAPAPAAQNVPTAATVPVASPAQPAPAATAAAAAPMPANQKESRLQWLKQMRDANLISSGEYETKRQQVLSAP
ncbi:DUF2846 domain-containing protein [Acidovorax sp. Root219]|uniref:DUF2846 domain-containing protein n=1 Tax=Acidovorax sp. Root219 TaxID=1736493 RepID=UPI00070B2FD4|nr:DUF2846 domain-containing protein [Acidovorax sp. Root219]KRC29032.1 hypothetical protein ASE28_19065 [Acidovorax sp. Root219]